MLILPPAGFSYPCEALRCSSTLVDPANHDLRADCKHLHPTCAPHRGSSQPQKNRMPSKHLCCVQICVPCLTAINWRISYLTYKLSRKYTRRAPADCGRYFIARCSTHDLPAIGHRHQYRASSPTQLGMMLARASHLQRSWAAAGAPLLRLRSALPGKLQGSWLPGKLQGSWRCCCLSA